MTAPTDSRLEAAASRLQDEIRRIDPTVSARFGFRWFDGRELIDVDLEKGGVVARLEFTTERALSDSSLEPDSLRSDLSTAIAELSRERTGNDASTAAISQPVNPVERAGDGERERSSADAGTGFADPAAAEFASEHDGAGFSVQADPENDEFEDGSQPGTPVVY